MQKRQIVYCQDESVYGDIHLTKRKAYEVFDVGVGTKKGKVRIRGDKDRLVWISDLYFSENEIPKIKSITIDDRIDDPFNDGVDVTVEFEDNTARWLFFMTVKYLENRLDKDNDFFSGNKIIFVQEIREDLIKKTIEELDRTNELVENSQPC